MTTLEMRRYVEDGATLLDCTVRQIERNEFDGNHWEAYLSLFQSFKSPWKVALMALSCMKCGANQAGLKTALLLYNQKLRN